MSKEIISAVILKDGCVIDGEEYWCYGCPFPDCYCFNPGLAKRFLDTQKARELENQGITLKRIAELLGRDEETINLWLNQR